MFWNKGKLTYGFRSEFNQATAPTTTFLTEVPLGAPFEIIIEVSSSGVVILSATCNGRTGRSPALQLASTWNARNFNFHGGVYNQIDFTDSTPAEDGSVCVISRLELTHF